MREKDRRVWQIHVLLNLNVLLVDTYVLGLMRVIEVKKAGANK